MEQSATRKTDHRAEPAESPDGLRAQIADPLGRDRIARALIVVAAFLSFALSVTLYFSGDEEAGIFVGIWVPSILALGALLVPRSRAGRARD